MDNPRLEYLREKVKKLPLQPGIYIMKDKKGQIIYIGKAKALKNRVSSYFRSVEKHTPKVYRMVENVWDFEYIVTSSEFEALVLECSFIKQHTPKYNILLKDDKGYHYIRVGGGEYGKITACHQPLKDGARYLGPYISGYVVKQTVDEVNKVFLLPTCNRNFPQEIGKQRPCLNYHIKQCMAPCSGKISPQEYAEALEEAVSFLKGSSANIQKILTQKMMQAAEAMQYEKAARYRDRIRAIQGLAENQKVVSIRYEEEDVIALVQSSVKCCAVVLQFRDYRLVDKEYFMLDELSEFAQNASFTDNKEQAVEPMMQELRTQFVLRYYDMKQQVPKAVVLDGPPSCQQELEDYLCQKAQRSVQLLLPQKGDQMKLLQMAKENASQQIAEQTRRTSREISALDELARLLGLHQVPNYIEAYDISNIGSETIVAGMVVFEGGRPLKGAYRKFSVRSVVGKPDDYASMREVLTRRLERYEQHKQEGVGFGRLPDLILLDGGRGHVAAVKPLVRQMGFDIPVFGMAKDDRHRTRTIATEDGELSVSSFRAAFDLLTSIQDEVHRFSIGYSRSKHASRAMESVLRSVEGIGEKRAKNLFLRFRTLKAMEAATVEQLEETPGMTHLTALNLYRYLHENDGQ
ncbi:MAG: excinuclease ABC subunit UvrC [Negativibacillus sp.]|nr:excinuclease ABC subunit UvrC [Negativibacillus sp.]